MLIVPDSLDLPSPDPDALAHSERLRQRIAAQINTTGPLAFDHYWERAMYEPGLGYYSAGARKFGADGDFVTAPELGNVFARCLAEPISQALADLGGADLLELGAGTGVFARDLLTDLRRRKQLPERYRILERSADLRQRQQQTLADFGDRVQWLDTPPAAPWSGIIFGNEVLDALAAKRVVKTPDGWAEQSVGEIEGILRWVTQPAQADTLTAMDRIEQAVGQLPSDYQTELQPSLPGWIKTISESLTEGLVLLVDYGYPRREYYLPDRSDGTLICHYRHRAHYDPLLWPGLNDLSVSVDFTAVAEALDAAGLTVEGITSQANFLLDTGLDRIIHEAMSLAEIERAKLNAQIKTLVLPAEMGEHIKVIAASRGRIEPGTGFASNQLGRL